MNKTVKWILIVLAVLIVGLIAVKAMGKKDNDGLKVTAEKAAKRTITETVNASGKVYPEVEVKISPDISGEVVELNVEEGDSVKRGQVLAKIYADIYASQRDEASSRVAQSQASVANSQASLESLKAELDQAKQAYNRNKGLYEDKVISKAEFETFETQLRTAQSQYNAAQQNIRSLQASTQGARTSLEQANKNLGRTTLVAPMDGVISSLSVKKGERVAGNSFNVGTEMMRVANMSSMEVRVDVGENDIVKVHIGDSADVEVEAYNNRKFKGVVTQIASSTKTGSSLTGGATGDVTNYEVRIRLDAMSYADLIDPMRPKNFPFRPGMNASADIKTKKKENVVTVPIGAVAPRIKGSDKSIEDQKKENKKTKEQDEDNADQNLAGSDVEEVVFVIDAEGKAQKRTVTTGIQDINYFEITSGLKEGETVVTAPFEAVNKTLKSGKKVNVVAKDKLFEN
jgi:HlyD family secretion protein